MNNSLAIDMLLGATFIDDNILEILREKQKVTVRNYYAVVVIEKGNTAASTVLNTIDTTKRTSRRVH